MPKIKEKFPARVTDNQDPEKRGRVRVTCSGLMGDDETVLPDWVEPAFSWGAFQVPDIGELIEIECNSIDDQAEDAPYQAFLENPDIKWSGTRFDSLEAGTPRPPDVLFTSKNYGKRRGFCTPAGHVLMFDDTDSDQAIILTWRKGDEYTQLSMDKDGSILLLDRKSNMIHLNAKDDEEGITLLDKNSHLIAMTADGITAVDNFSNIIEMKDGVVTVLSAGDMQIQASKGVNLQGGAGEANVTLNADGKIEINADDADVEITCANALVDADTYSLGKSADSGLVRWLELQPWLDSHTHPTALGPSGPAMASPVGPVPPAAESMVGTLKCSIWSVLFTLAMLFWFLR